MMNYDVRKIYRWPLVPRIVVYLAASLMVFLICYIIDIPSYKNRIAYDISQEKDMKEQLQLMLNQQITVKGNIAQLSAIKALLQEWQRKIVTKVELQSLLNQVLKTGQANQLKITSFNPDDNQIKDGIYFKTAVSIDMSGTYDQIANFISQLANMPKLVNIDAFTITRPSDNERKSGSEVKALNSDDVLDAKLHIEIYQK